MYERLLLAVDGSVTATLATERALEFATAHGTVVHALYVVEKTRDEPLSEGLEEAIAADKRNGKEVLEEIEASATDQGVEIETTLERGVPRSTIVEYAEDTDTGLVVLGSLGADSLGDKMLGTVSKHVINEAPADVFVIRPDESKR